MVDGIDTKKSINSNQQNNDHIVLKQHRTWNKCTAIKKHAEQTAIRQNSSNIQTQARTNDLTVQELSHWSTTNCDSP